MAEIRMDRPNFGFGCMRLPRLETGAIDVEQFKKMVDVFLESGFVYFDTAYGYDGSENALQEALVKRYPRDSYVLATKLTMDRGMTKEEAERRIYTSMERLGVDFIDYYLLHNVVGPNIEICDKNNLWSYVKKLKEKGVVRHYGFSTHAGPEVLDELLTAHPDMDFVQLQINYLDWEDEGVQSRKCLEVARKHGKPVIVMEPCKGGALANFLPEEAQAIFKKIHPELSCASWALRYAASKPGVAIVLSGMSTLEQVKDNMTFMKDIAVLTEEEEHAVDQVMHVIKAVPQIQCTGCEYCTRVCPTGIPIPKLIRVMNRYQIFPDLGSGKFLYNMNVGKGAKASECVGCGICEEACPQHLLIRDLLKNIAETFE